MKLIEHIVTVTVTVTVTITVMICKISGMLYN
nr:MAG TPA: hypothetical protein [Caudoviricetes sp.]